MDSLFENAGLGEAIVEDLIPKKVRFRHKEEEVGNDMLIDSPSGLSTSWRGKLVRHSAKEDHNKSDDIDAFDFLEGDIQKTVVNGLPSITFSDRIHQILLQGLDNTVVLKLLGRNIGFSVLQNKIYNMWRPLEPIHMMDIENNYFLVKFQNKRDCEKALAEGLWIIFGQYLTIQSWTMAFDTSQAYLSVVMPWIRFPALPSYLYSSKIITEIGELIGKVVKLNMNTDSRTRGRFTRLAVYVNLEKPLVSHILINGRSQKVKYESLSSICFHCGRYGHVENLCNFRNSGPTIEVSPKFVRNHTEKLEPGCGWFEEERRELRAMDDY
ncbi:hypothetical protein J1N35_018146 [Gossypium stocksii]|uniref:CCHC-type domain-containing protein n=1 Tax=Gossypium stocksii TaxID=47602 RepID=A0A9D3VNQ3_9ROSI|nr:hypothetical protein J1N35_018146 [Gossypium stocksii]